MLLTAALFSLPLLANVFLERVLGIYVFYLGAPHWQLAFATAVLAGPGLGFWRQQWAERARGAGRQALGAVAAYVAYGAGAYAIARGSTAGPGALFELAGLAMTALLLLRTLVAWRAAAATQNSGPEGPDR